MTSIQWSIGPISKVHYIHTFNQLSNVRNKTYRNIHNLDTNRFIQDKTKNKQIMK